MSLFSAMLMDGMPHGYCLLWDPGLLWLHAGSDGVIALAYFMIPVSLIRFVQRRRDVPFNFVFFSFGAFILLCGTTHVLSIYNVWVPNWWLSGIVKALTAVASVVTAIVLVKLLPAAIALPSQAQLNALNAELARSNALLRAEATDLEYARAALARANDEAEELVRVRTAELAESNTRLQLSEARYRALVQSSADIVWTTTSDGAPADVREFSQFTGIAADRVSEERFTAIHPDEAEQVREAWQAAIAVAEPFESEHRLRSADGTWRNVKVHAVPVLDATGDVREWVGTHTDISSQVESSRQLALMQEQLQQSQRLEAVGRLAGGIAHDFNNLLTVITGAGNLVLDMMPREHIWRRDIEDVVAAGTRAAALTAQLLAYSRKQVLQPRLLDIDVVLRDVYPMLNRLIGEQVTVNIVAKKENWAVSADPNQLEQVILNLALNARDAMPNGGTITFETQSMLVDGEYMTSHVGVASGEYVMLAVSDTGTGMDEVTRTQIFEPFFTTKGVGKGTGLGLATVYGIVRQSGGHIYVYSEPGLGTTFKIYLPRADGDAERSDAGGTDVANSTGIRETILLVEDSADVREFVARVLARSGYTVLLADGPASALQLLDQDATNAIHLMLSDVIMPGMNGRQLADIVAVRRPEIAILFMSGYTDNAIVHHGVLDPRTHFLHKPFTPHQLLSEIRRALADHAQRQR